MDNRETPQSINDLAVTWLARLDAAGDDPKVHAELETWLAGDRRHQGAFFRARSAWTMLDRARAFRAPHQDQMITESKSALKSVFISRRKVVAGGAAVAASAVASVLGYKLISASSMQIQTAIGEVRSVPLTDGSYATINTSTDLAVDMKKSVRRIALSRGEAWFQVAKDGQRPFIVEVGDVRVRAVGTAFAVRRMDAGADVQVTEGVVEVWCTSDDGNIRRVAAGERTYVSPAEGPGPAVEASSQIDRSLAWRAGQLVFNGESLSTAAAEFNRYNTVKIDIADPRLAAETIIGRFRTNDPQAFANATSTLFGAKVTEGTNRLVLSRN